MLDKKASTEIVKQNFPEGKIQAVVQYKSLYLFQVFTTNPFEEELDPFYSVDRETGDFRDFSILTDGPTSVLLDLFAKAKE